mgnify:FL=1|jgi:hypothetical protein
MLLSFLKMRTGWNGETRIANVNCIQASNYSMETISKVRSNDVGKFKIARKFDLVDIGVK